MSQDSSQKAPLKILVIDDHELILEGSLDVIRQQYPEARIFTAKTASEAIACVQSIGPDLAIVDTTSKRSRIN
jgi:DNA-binding NarL/FixJ family response regulator